MYKGKQRLAGPVGALAVGGLILTGCSQGAQNTEPIENTVPAAASCQIAADVDAASIVASVPPQYQASVQGLIDETKKALGANDEDIAIGLNEAMSLPASNSGAAFGLQFLEATDTATNRRTSTVPPNSRVINSLEKTIAGQTGDLKNWLVEVHSGQAPCPAAVAADDSGSSGSTATPGGATGSSGAGSSTDSSGSTPASTTQQLVVKVKGTKESKVVVRGDGSKEKLKVKKHKAEFALLPGDYKVKAKKAGYEKAKKNVTIDDSQVKVKLKLKAK